METPNSGPDLTTNLGDISKLDFLNNIPLNSTDEGGGTDIQGVDTSGDVKIDSTADSTPDTSGDTGDFVPLNVIPDPATPPPPPANNQPNPPQGKFRRDYTGIDPADVDIFKQMSDKAYQRAMDWYNKSRTQPDISKFEQELNELRDYRFYQHPEGYRLSPEYSKAVQEYQTQDTIINHYRSQLAALKAGNPIRDIGFDKDGKLTLLPTEIPPSPEVEANLTAVLQEAMIRRQGVIGQLENIQQSFTTKSKSFDEQLAKATDMLASPELMKDKTFKSAYEGYLTKVIPPHLQNVPIYKHLAKMAAFIQTSARQIAALQKQLSVQGVRQNTLRQQGPGEGLPTSTPSNGDFKSRKMKDVLAEMEAFRAEM